MLWAFARGMFAWIGFGVLVGGAFAIITSPRPAPDEFGYAPDEELLPALPPAPREWQEIWWQEI